ncbi:MAG: 2-hydroxyacyl-CoA dehydratase family protein [Chloroflexi bacterium]|nr:2-hydroxyacyl-CoA dehydratase family protein [Chloroflexota bacterium]
MTTTSRSQKSMIAAREVYGLVKSYYQEMRQAREQGVPVVWYSGQAPVELLEAAGVFPYLIEQYCPVAAAKQLAPLYLDAAERRGYSEELCSYATVPIGVALEIDNPRFHHANGGPVKPDFLVTSHFLCDQRVKYIKAIGRILDRPVGVIDCVHNIDIEEPSDIKQYHLDYYVTQYQELIRFVEQQTGRPYDMNRLGEVVEEFNHGIRLFMAGLEYQQSVPAPMSASDFFAIMFPLFVRPGRRETTEFCGRFHDEMKARSEQGIGAVTPEKYRLMFDGLPMWFNLGLLNYFEEAGASFAAFTMYIDRFIELDPERPLESMARRELLNHINSHALRRIEYVGEIARKFKLDGIFMPGFESCKPIYVHQEELKRAMRGRLDLPTLSFETDFLDERYYSDALAKSRIDAFLEILEERRAVACMP